MLKNRKVAWLITVTLMTIGLFFGSFLSYWNMRGQVVEVFRADVEPVLNEKIQMLYNMLTIYKMNAADAEDLQIIEDFVTDNIERTQNQMVSVSWQLSTEVIILSHHSENLFNLTEGLEMSEADTRFMRNFRTDIQELQMIIGQSRYNVLAEAFNESTQSGLGFLTRLWDVAGSRQLPVF